MILGAFKEFANIWQCPQGSAFWSDEKKEENGKHTRLGFAAQENLTRDCFVLG